MGSIIIKILSAFCEWTRSELIETDRMKRKIMTMNRALHPRDSVCRLFLPRKEGGRGLIGVEVCIDLAVLSLRKYVGQNEDRLIVAARGNDMAERDDEKEFKKRKVKKGKWNGEKSHSMNYIYDRRKVLAAKVRGCG